MGREEVARAIVIVARDEPQPQVDYRIVEVFSWVKSVTVGGPDYNLVLYFLYWGLLDRNVLVLVLALALALVLALNARLRLRLQSRVQLFHDSTNLLLLL